MKSYMELTKRYLIKNKKRSILTIITIAIAMAIITSFSMIYDAQEKEDRNNLKANMGYYDVTFEGLNREQYDKLAKDERIEQVSKAKQEGAVIVKGVNDSLLDSYDLIRLTPEAYDNVFKFKLLQGRLPEKSDEILLDYEAANNMGFAVNLGMEIDFDLYPNSQKVRSQYRKNSTDEIDSKIESMDLEQSKKDKKEAKYKVVGISENMSGQKNIYGFISDDELYSTDKIDTFATLTNSKKLIWGEWGYGSEKAVADDLGIKFLMRNDTESKGNIGSQVKYLDYSSITDQDEKVTTGNSTMIFVIVNLFMFITIFNMFNISVYERIRHIGIIRAIGGTMKQVRNIVLGEAAVYATIGIPIGLLIGYVLTKLTVIPIGSILNVDMSELQLRLTFGDSVKSIILFFLVIMFSAMYGIAKQIKMSPVEAMSTVMGGNKNKVDAIANNKLINGKGNVESNLAYKNLRKDIGRNNLCTIVIAMSMILFIWYSNIFLNGLNNISTSIPSTEWNIDANKSGNPLTFKTLDAEKKEEIKNIKGIEDVYSTTSLNLGIPIEEDKIGSLLKKEYESEKEFLRIDRSYKDNYLTNVYVRIVDEDSVGLYNKYLEEGSIDYDKLNNDGILLVNSASKKYIMSVTDFGDISYHFESSSDMLNVSVGESMNIPKGNYPLENTATKEMLKDKEIDKDNFVPFKINGILSEDALRDNINKYSTKEMLYDFKIIMTKECYEKNFGPILNESILIDSNENINRGELVEYINNIIDKDLYNITDYVEIQNEETQKVNKNLLIQAMFLISLFIIVVINITSIFYASIVMRKKELASLRAIGMGINQMKKMIFTEVLILAGEACIWALAIGGGSTLFKELNLRKIGMSNIQLWFMILVLSIIVVLTLSFVSAWKSIKKVNGISIVEDLREEE